MGDDSGNAANGSENPDLIRRVEDVMGEQIPVRNQSSSAAAPNPIPPPATDDMTIPNEVAEAPISEPMLPKNDGAEEGEQAPVDTPEPEQDDNPEAVPVPPETVIDDDVTDRAVAGIMAEESDIVLSATQPQPFKDTRPPKEPRSFRTMIKNKWFWGVVVIVIVTFFAVPYTRYTFLGLFIKKDALITVVDSKTQVPVSGAIVSFAGTTIRTNGDGAATVKAPLGSHAVSVTKQYFKNYSGHIMVGFKNASAPHRIEMVATGRPVSVTIMDTITHRPLSEATISVLDTTAKTNAQGQATIVVPPTSTTYSATLTAPQYHTLSAQLSVAPATTTTNTYYLLPDGKIFFLSNLSGKIDVVSTNLDGSERTTVLAGTGNEDPYNTQLIASRDWKYLVLKSQRTTKNPGLYLIDTSTGQVTNFDTGDADFTLIGWSGHDFLYDVVRNSYNLWQNGREVIKSYDADNNQLNQLDQTLGEGGTNDYAGQSYGSFVVMNNLLLYTSNWTSYNSGGQYDLSGKTDAIVSIAPNGQNKKNVKTFDAAQTSFVQGTQYLPEVVYYVANDSTNNNPSYYVYNNGAFAASTTINQSSFNTQYPTYLYSPSGNSTFWSEMRDGQYSDFVGDANAGSSKQLLSLSPYQSYGWFSDDYVIVSKGTNELDIMSSTGFPDGVTQPLKISNYYSPPQGYSASLSGYSYGGL